MAPLEITVRSKPAASPLEMAEAQALSKEEGLGVEGARTRMRRGSASSEMLTRVEEGWGGEVVVIVVAILLLVCEGYVV